MYYFFSNIHTYIILLIFFIQSSLCVAQLTVNAGPDKTICAGDSVVIGGSPSFYGGTAPYSYSWAPTISLVNPNTPNPIAFPSNNTTYTLNVQDASGATKNAKITVFSGQIPQLKVIKDTSIKEGTVAYLYASGGSSYRWWSNTEFLRYNRTVFPEAEPTNTTRYYVEAWDITGACKASDSVLVIVAPSDELVFYNTFTPNGDGENDEWYIGNVEKYSNNRLEIYNRYGKKVYEKNNYDNSWTGKAFGERLPAATYFYIFDLGNGSAPYKGTLTIVE